MEIDKRMRNGFIKHNTESIGSFCEHGNEFLVSTKGREIY
jgi:hypothetical protein